MEKVIRHLETLKRFVSATFPSDDALSYVADSLGCALDQLKQNCPTPVNPFDQDKIDEQNRCVMNLINMMNDATQKIKKRYDAAVKRVDYTQELSETAKILCMLAEHAAGLYGLMKR